MSENPIIQIHGGSYDPITGQIEFDDGQVILLKPLDVDVITGPPGPPGPSGDQGEPGIYRLAQETWAGLSALNGIGDGQACTVLSGDTGTHQAATATGYDGAIVANSGEYVWVAEWQRWQRVADYSIELLDKKIDDNQKQILDNSSVVDSYFSSLNLPTPDRGSENVIEPPVETERATYDFTKKGKAYELPDTRENGNGVYYVSRSLPFPCAAYRDRRFSYYSPDHGNRRSGIYLAVCVDDPSIPTNWRPYDQALAAGWLDDFENKPAAAPIYLGGGRDTGTQQVETPVVVKVGATYVMTYQVANGDIGRNQSTLRAVSSDGLNWTGDEFSVLSVPSSEVIGDGHTGYMSWNKNPFNNVINPATGLKYLYVGYSLVGGQSRSTTAFWGTDEPIAGEWDFITAMNKISGRASPSNNVGNWFTFALINADMSSAKITRQGVSLICAAAVRGSGATAKSAQIYEILMAHDGVTMLGEPQILVAKGDVDSIDEGAADRGEVSIYSDKAVLLYTAATSSNEKVAAIATSPIRSAQNTWFGRLYPLIPDPVVTRRYDFKGASQLPTGLEEVRAGTTLPTPVFNDDGLSITVDGTQSTKDEYYLYDSVGIDPAICFYVDIYIEDWVTTSSTAYRIPFIGFATKKALRAAQTDAIFLSNGEGTAGKLSYQVLIDGVEPIVEHPSDYYWGIGFGDSVSTTARSKKNLGIRYFPRQNRAYVLGEGGVEMEELVTSNGNYVENFRKDEMIYPVVGFRGTGTKPATERFSSMTVKEMQAGSKPGDATAGSVVQRSSTSSATSYRYDNVDIGNAQTDRKIALWVSGRSFADLTPSVSLTVDSELINMDLIELHHSNFDNATTSNALFVASVATGTTATVRISLAGGGMLRNGMALLPLYGVAKTPFKVYSSSNKIGTASLSALAEKTAGGLVVANAIYSTSGGTGIKTAKERTPIDIVDNVELKGASGGNPRFVGLDTQFDPHIVESESSAGHAMIVASWKKA